jgi:hypothetical protein
VSVFFVGGTIMSKWSAAFRDSRWQKKRLQVMERDNWKCQSCGASGEGITLNVHHAFYESGKAPWEYPDHTLVTWCETCHEKRHEITRQCQWHFAFMPLDCVKGVLELALGSFEKTLKALAEFSEDLPDDDALAASIATAKRIDKED